MSLFIRIALPSDIPMLLDLNSASFREYAALVGIQPDQFAPLTENEEDIESDLRKKKIWIGFYNKTKAIGSIRCQILPDNVAYISRFSVLPNWQQVGMGNALMQTAETFCMENGVAAMALHTCTKLLSQVRFYTAQGYFVHSTTQDRGYIRGLFIKELSSEVPYSLDTVISY